MVSKNLTIQIFFLIILVLCNCSGSDDSFEKIIETHLQRYPQMQVEDLYKLTHQAAMGNIHLGVEPRVLKNYLYSELEKIEASDEEPLFEEISPDNLIRLNLRPFKLRGGDPEKLVEAMKKTAQLFQPDKEKLIQYWKVIERMAEMNLISFNDSKLDLFFEEMQNAGFPAVHHSDKYSESYKPAYRVILKQTLQELK